MKMKELVLKNRSTRAFDETRKITREELTELVALARLAPSAVNRQPLKYFLSCDEKTNAVIQNRTAWAGLLKDLRLPPEGHCPTAFIAILTDTSIAENADRDIGIAAQTILLGAVEMGLNGCMIGAFKPELHDELGLPAHLKLSLLVALGKGEEEILIEDATDSVAYYRDGAGRHIVPKRTLDELIIEI